MSRLKALRPRRGIFAVLICALLASCGGDSSGPVDKIGPPAAVAVVSGGGQTATVSSSLPAPIVVRVTDAAGHALSAITVTWAVASGNGTLAEPTSVTDAQGTATTHWSLGTVATEQSITARATGTPAVTITARGTAAAASTAKLLSGADQTGAANSEITPLAIQVTDVFGNGVPNAAVQWAVELGGGAINPATSTTDSTGRATATWKLGTRTGPQRASGFASTLPAQRITFSATAIAGPATRVTVTEDSLRFSALQDSVLLTASAEDAFGNAVTGTGITWTSQATSIATVSATGRVIAAGNGTTVVKATAGSAVSDSVIVRVQQIAASITLSAHAVTLSALGRKISLGFAVKDKNGFALAVPQIEWSALDPATATVDASGSVTAVAIGVARIRISTAALADTANITVRQIPASISLTPTSLNLNTGQAQTMTASLADSSGALIPAATADGALRFTTSQAAVASVDATTGAINALTAGTVVIRAQSVTVPAIADSSYIAVTAANSILATAIPFGSTGTLSLARNQTLRVPVTIDMSRVSATGDLGAADVKVRFSATALQFDSAQVVAGAVGNLSATGEYSIAFAGTNAVGASSVIVGTVFLKVLPTAVRSTDAVLNLIFPYAPVSTGIVNYQAPVVLPGRVRIQ